MQLASSEILIQLLWGRWEALANLTRRGPLPRLCSHIGGFPDEERNGQCPGMLAGRGKEVPACPSQGDSYIYVCTHTHTYIYIHIHIYIHTHTYIYTHIHHTAPPLLQGAEKHPPPKLPRLHSCKLNPAWGLPAQKGQERRVKEDLETRPPAERLDEINIQRAGPRSPGGAC